MKCDLCGRNAISFWRVNHPDRRIINICEECYRKEHDRLPPPDRRDFGCCR
jgi:ribosome-binding protein aMBF1 (putative translation factor)